MLKLTVLALTAGFFLTAAVEPIKDQREIAMNKCSKNTKSQDDDGSDSYESAWNDVKSKPSKDVPPKKKSAAKRAVEGD